MLTSEDPADLHSAYGKRAASQSRYLQVEERRADLAMNEIENIPRCGPIIPYKDLCSSRPPEPPYLS